MPILLMGLWLLFNERITIDVIVAGIIVIALLCFFLHKIGVWSPQGDLKVASLIPAWIGFVLRLVYEVFKANIHMIALVLSPNPNERISPRIVKHKSKLKSSGLLVALANSITLTPGTVTIDVGDDSVYVHAIDEYALEGLDQSVLEKKLENMEKKV